MIEKWIYKKKAKRMRLLADRKELRTRAKIDSNLVDLFG